MGQMKTYGNVHGYVKHLAPNTSRPTPVRGLLCLTHTTHTTQTTHTQETNMTVIEMQSLTSLVHNLPRVAKALEDISKSLKAIEQVVCKDTNSNDNTNATNTNAEQGDANE